MKEPYISSVSADGVTVTDWPFAEVVPQDSQARSSGLEVGITGIFEVILIRRSIIGRISDRVE
jgi:hypothetical protein